MKVLLGNSQILLFDEPTAVLAPSEIARSYSTSCGALRAEGRSLVFVSHKLNEVMALCDRVTVLRRGRNVGTVSAADTSPEDMARRMVGDKSDAAEEVGRAGWTPPLHRSTLCQWRCPHPELSTGLCYARWAGCSGLAGRLL